jgi:hypothetical protein
MNGLQTLLAVNICHSMPCMCLMTEDSKALQAWHPKFPHSVAEHTVNATACHQTHRLTHGDMQPSSEPRDRAGLHHALALYTTSRIIIRSGLLHQGIAPLPVSKRSSILQSTSPLPRPRCRPLCWRVPCIVVGVLCSNTNQSKP